MGESLVIQETRTTRKQWDVEFTSHPEEVATLRRVVALRLAAWSLPELVDTARLCVSELVSNVLTHVGIGTPGLLALSVNGANLRIEVHDPDTRALPAVVLADAHAEGGRGMTLVDALADRWGVQLHEDHKVTWCELATGAAPPGDSTGHPSVTRAEALLDLYATLRPPRCSYEPGPGKVGRRVAEESAIDVITDFLHWLQARGRDVDEVLDHAQSRIEAAPSANGR
ncbi:ATP-binding protein [Streptomyces cathayae]|uniref:ATP-binding protein n=1 Tax=Streptomyces cathayae TaxID=3031124 RepID=A0ABY8K367_9ACTN|nr:ATP-binding protein [Streptomyces sp. HUAS 5]WGD42722.1 ATP-binding protein [Streptomyces sp. HUAS 5]